MSSTVAQALARARADGVARLDAQWLLAHLLGRDRAWLTAHDDARLDPEQQQAFVAGLARRAAGEPLAYVIGECRFAGVPLRVNASVLVPRPETELLVDWALECLAALGESVRADVIDLGTGSGAVALAIATRAPGASVTATDLDASALDVARANAARLHVTLRLREGSWWDAIAGTQRYHVAVCNPPYVAAGDPHLLALGHEPRHALTPGGDGLSALFDVIDGADAHLHANGWLLLEHGHDQGGEVRRRLETRGFADVRTRCDLAGMPRCSAGRRASLQTNIGEAR